MELLRGVIPKSWLQYKVSGDMTAALWVADFARRVQQLERVVSGTGQNNQILLLAQNWDVPPSCLDSGESQCSGDPPSFRTVITKSANRRFLTIEEDSENENLKISGEYRVTHLLSKNLPLTWIWDVMPSCLGSRQL